MNSVLKTWIAQSESWRTYKDFNISKDFKAEYNFLLRPDDFYINLIGRLFDILDEAESRVRSVELISIAKGLEIYSLSSTKQEFNGIDTNRNLLYVGSLYYLCDYSCSAWIMGKLLKDQQFESEIDVFISCFLQRDIITPGNEYIKLLQMFMLTGSEDNLKLLESKIDLLVKNYKNLSPYEFTSAKIGLKIIHKFRQNNIWTTLNKYIDISDYRWKTFIKENMLMRNPPIWDFFPSQNIAFDKGLFGKTSASLQMPTSAGKTSICEVAIYNEYLLDRKVLFLAPFRALASELKFGFAKRLSVVGVKSLTAYGNTASTSDDNSSLDDVNLFITTPERFQGISKRNASVYKQFATIICDEGHLIDSRERGIRYELLLSKLKILGDENIRFIFLSAIIPNIENINNWLGGDGDSVVRTNYKPTQLDYAFLQESKLNTYQLSFNPHLSRPESYFLANFITERDLGLEDRIKKENVTKKRLSVITALKSISCGPVALFSTTGTGQMGVIQLGFELIKVINNLDLVIKPLDYCNLQRLGKLKEYFTRVLGVEHILTQLISYGIVIHYGDIPQDIREIIENAIQDKDVPLVVCTTTLAEGVNLPIKTIVIHTISRFNSSTNRFKHILSRDLKNIIGRVGRAGKETRGQVIVTNPKDYLFLEQIITEKSNEEVVGFLYRFIHEVFKRRIIFSDEFIERQSEGLKEIIDEMDTSLLDLLSEELDLDQAHEIANKLVKSSFAYKSMTGEEQNYFSSIMVSRVDKLFPILKSTKYPALKKSGASPRIFELLYSRIDISHNAWFALNSLDEAWVDYLFSLISLLPTVLSSIDGFNKKYKVSLTIDDLKRVSIDWISGMWYGDISKKHEIPIDILLKLFNSVIQYSLQNAVSSILNIAESKFEESNSGIEMSNNVKQWVNCIIYGMNTTVQINLILIGVSDRTAVFSISNLLQSMEIPIERANEIAFTLLINQKRIIEHMRQNSVPEISIERTRRDLKHLSQGFEKLLSE